jgi:hypothetical protein
MAVVTLSEFRPQAPNDDASLSRSGPSQLTLVAAVIGFFVVTLDAVVVNVALPSIGHAFGGGISGLQWVVDGYTLALPGCCCGPGRYRTGWAPAGLSPWVRGHSRPLRRRAGWPPASGFSSLPGLCRARLRRR